MRTEPDVVVLARHRAESVKSEILLDFRRVRNGRVALNAAEVRRFERRWLHGCRDVENRVVALGPAGQARANVEQVRPILAEIYQLVLDCAAALERAIEDEAAQP